MSECLTLDTSEPHYVTAKMFAHANISAAKSKPYSKPLQPMGEGSEWNRYCQAVVYATGKNILSKAFFLIWKKKITNK